MSATFTPANAAAGALEVLRRGIGMPIPLPKGTKKPTTKAWQDQRFTEAEIPYVFTSGVNLGLLLGPASNGLTDADLDTDEAVILGRLWLPRTGLWSGRGKRPSSHAWYRTPAGTPYMKLNDPTRKGDDACLVELRAADGETGRQTVIAPSRVDGDLYQWEEFGEPAKVNTPTITEAVQWVAAGALVARHYPPHGTRHEAVLAFAGFLLRRGMTKDYTLAFLQGVAEAASQKDPSADSPDAQRDIKAAVLDTAAGLETKKRTTGGKKLLDFFDGKVLDAVSTWLNLTAEVVRGKETAQAPTVATVSSPARDTTSDEKESAAQVLIRIGEANSFLFHDERETAQAAIGPDDARRIVSTKSDVFTKFLCGRFYAQTGKGANGEAVSTARNVLASKAIFDGPRHVLHNRFAWHEGALWIDLADAKRRAARVTSDGWTLEVPPILFRSFKRQAPLPEPQDGGDIRKLLGFVNVASEDDQVLLQTWLALAFFEQIPRPILDIHGPQGGGKTTAAKMLRRLTDPSAAGTNHLSNKDEELALAFETNAVPYFDNVVHLSNRQAELLCQAVTGGGFSKRELFTDSDEVLYDFRRAVIITGINIPTVAPDLLDRFLMIQLERVSRESRRTESALWTAFDAASPALFGGLLSAVSSAMARHPRIVKEEWELERMADWCLWGIALSESIGTTPEAFLAAYRRNVGRQTEEVLESDPVARAVRDLVHRDGGFSGTASELFKLLRDRVGDEVKTEGWPKRADGLSRRLRVLQSTMADVGIALTWERASTIDRSRTVRIGRVPSRMYPETASNASNASETPVNVPLLDAPDALDAIPGDMRRVTRRVSL